MAWHHCLLTSTLTLTLPLTLTYYLPQAIRELLGKRGRAAWARRIFDAVYRAWKDIYVKVIPDPEPNRNPAPISNPNIYVKVCSKSVKVCSKSSLPPCFLTHCLSYYVKGKAQRVAAGHQLHVRERVERSMREVRQPHAQKPHPQHTTPSIHLCAPIPTPSLTRTRSGSSTACSSPS